MAVVWVKYRYNSSIGKCIRLLLLPVAFRILPHVVNKTSNSREAFHLGINMAVYPHQALFVRKNRLIG